VFALGARTRIHSGRRGRSATGRDVSIGPTSLETVVPEAPLERVDNRLRPGGEGWFVLNARETTWFESDGLGFFGLFESEDVQFPQVGLNLALLRPGEPNGMYHGEDAQEDFLVLSGECLLLVEGQERRLKAWDFVHCPPLTEHIFVGAGDRPCLIVMIGARRKGRPIRYPVSEVALEHGAGVETETTEPREAYAGFGKDRPVPCPPEFPDSPG
jgi:uncharacterized cupin superfamily protein